MQFRITHVLRALLESYVFILLAALLLGVVWPEHLARLAPHTTLLLGAIFFLSSMRTDLGVLFSYFSKVRALLAVNFFMLFVLGAVVFFLARWLYPEAAIAFLLLAAMPAGMTSPFLTSIVGGREDFALVLSLSTSLLAPLTIPLLFFLLLGREVEVSFLSMVWSLVKVLIIPFILARVAYRVFGTRRLEPTFKFHKSISLILLGLLIAAVVAANQATIVVALTSLAAIKYLLLLVAFFLSTFALGYFLTPWLAREERVTVANCVTFMNFILAIYLAGEYFNTPEVVIPVVLSMLIWSASVAPWKRFVRRFLLS